MKTKGNGKNQWSQVVDTITADYNKGRQDKIGLNFTPVTN